MNDNHYQPCDNRFRTSTYFLQDQLRCASVVEELRSVKNLIQRAQAFTGRQAFQFQTASVPVQE